MAGVGGSEAGRLGDDIKLPRAGLVLVQAVTTAAVIDLGLGTVQSAAFEENLPPAGSPAQAGGIGQAAMGAATPQIPNPSGFLGHWVDITVDGGGGDLGYIAGPTSASVSGGNAPVLATTGGIGTAGACQRQAAGTRLPYYVNMSERFLGVVSSSGTCTIRISYSSR